MAALYKTEHIAENKIALARLFLLFQGVAVIERFEETCSILVEQITEHFTETLLSALSLNVYTDFLR